MKKKVWITVVLLLAAAAAAIAVRVFYVVYVMDKVNVDRQLLDLAQLKENGIVLGDLFAEGFSARTFYAMCLSFSCLLFGNFAVAGVYLNIAIQVFAALLLFGAGTNLFNRYVGLAVSAVFAFLPFVVKLISSVKEMNAVLFLAAAVVWLMSLVVYLFKNLRGKKGEKSLEENVQTEAETKVEIKAEEPVPVRDSSMREITLAEVEKTKPRFIENPLPVPKRRAHKEMDYALEIGEEDDFDVTDMAGKDFFDIE